MNNSLIFCKILTIEINVKMLLISGGFYLVQRWVVKYASTNFKKKFLKYKSQ